MNVRQQVNREERVWMCECETARKEYGSVNVRQRGKLDKGWHSETTGKKRVSE